MAEEFEIKYFDVGQGDCILIVCPDGKLVMIDCGSSKGLYAGSVELLNVCTGLREFTSKNNGKIDILILTHKDKDHYNQVYQVFTARTIVEETTQHLPRVDIDTVYFSSPAVTSTNYALTQFTVNSTGAHLIGGSYKTQTIKQVFINAAEQKEVTYTKATNFALASGTTKSIKGNKLTLLSDTTPAGKAWSVSIIAGQVPEKPGKPGQKKLDPTNALSLCTLLQFDNSKALFLGDATIETEIFLLAKHKNLIKDIDFVHVPHHGSRTSSHQNFVNNVNPKGAEVTHEPYETGNRLPKYNVLDRWLTKLELQREFVDDHALDYWMEVKEAKYNAILKAWKDAGIKPVKDGRTTYVARVPRTSKDRFIAVYKTSNQFWALYRKKTDLNLWGVGADDFNKWSLPVVV